MKIISIKEQLPLINTIVFAINTENFLGVAFYNGEKWIEASSNKEAYRVSHWILFSDQPERLSEKAPKGDAIV